MDGQKDEPDKEPPVEVEEKLAIEKAVEREKVEVFVRMLKQGEDVTCETDRGSFYIYANGINANEELLDKIFDEDKKETLTMDRLLELAKRHDAHIHHKSNHSTLPPIRKSLLDLHIELSIDGDRWCALIGENIQEGTAGFGMTKFEAILECIRGYKPLQQWYCMDCGQATDTLCSMNHQRDIGRCPACNMKNWLKTMPPPPLESMESASGAWSAYAKWPHHYIPAKCPYCQRQILRSFVGSYNDHTCYEHTCEVCAVYFGFTD